MTSTKINHYINDNTKGKESDYEIECSRNNYGVTTILIREKKIPCGCCKEVTPREKLYPKYWTDGQKFERSARVCKHCKVIMNELFGI